MENTQADMQVDSVNVPETPETHEKETVLSTLRETILSPSDSKLVELLQSVATECEQSSIPLLSAIPESGEIPDGMNVAIVPLKRTTGRGMPKELIGVAVSVVPTLEAISEHAKGGDWLRSVVEKKLTAKIKSAVMPKSDGGKPLGILPSKVEDYIVSSRSAFDMDGFNLVASLVVKLLRRRIPTIDKRILRQCLESQAFAESVYGDKLSSDDWLAVLDKMRTAAKAKGEDVAVFDHWEATRNEIVIEVQSDDEDFDLDALDHLID